MAVRARVPVYVSDEVMEQAAITPEEDLEGGSEPAEEQRRPPAETPDAFKDFLEGLDLTGLD